jgi:two-component system response regulator AtoC
MPTLLIVEDEPVLLRNLAKAFESRGWTARQAVSLAEARRAAAETAPDVVLLDLRLPDGSGLELLGELAATTPDLPVIMMTGHGSVADAVEAMKRGARDFVQKPLELEEIRLKVERALGAARQQREIAYYRERDHIAGSIVGESEAIRRLHGLVERLARATSGPRGPAPTVLLLGETGTGKGLVARALHAAGGRRDRPFIEVNCTALPETLMEAELFGHERGAFTDARTARAGLFEAADGGTLFLDEIGHISPALQSKFLKVIEEKTVRRIGAAAARAVDVHVIAATSRDLEAAVRLGEFGEDLYQRLAVAVIRIPPLRERGSDVVVLARHFLAAAASRYGSPPRSFSAAAEAALQAHGWPGNVRELANAMERAVLFSDAETLEPADLGIDPAAAAQGRVAAGPSGAVVVELPEGGLALEAVERALLAAALNKADGNQSAAARLLGVSRDTLRYRMEKFGLGQ